MPKQRHLGRRGVNVYPLRNTFIWLFLLGLYMGLVYFGLIAPLLEHI
jgi:hypothetical protein